MTTAAGNRFRVRLWDIGASRGRGALKAIIDDAADIGGSAYANAGGECFFTLPINHPQIAEVTPLTTHYEISRLTSFGVYTPIFTGLLDEPMEVTEDEVVVYGRDYLSLLETTITANGTSYSNTAIGSIISDQLTAARAEANSRVAFIGMGTIETTTTSATLISNYQPRLDFIASAAEVLMGSRSVRSIIAVEPRSSATPDFTFYEDKGSDKRAVRLEYGNNVRGFTVRRGGSGGFATRIAAVGQKREGATILYSTQTYASEATYGFIARPALFIDVNDQTSLDNLALRDARRAGQASNLVSLAIRAYDLAPWDGYDLGDAVPVVIQRFTSNTTSPEYTNGLYTVWGVEWIGKRDGSEEIFLDLRPKET